jgi:hypothetical protein
MSRTPRWITQVLSTRRMNILTIRADSPHRQPATQLQDRTQGTVVLSRASPRSPSTPTILPFGPSIGAATRVTAPVPQARSSTRAPALTPHLVTRSIAHGSNRTGTKHASYCLTACLVSCQCVAPLGIANCVFMEDLSMASIEQECPLAYEHMRINF